MNPAFKITADKRDVTALIAQRLVSINVTDETGLVSDTCEILLDNRDEKLEIPARGAVLEVSLGYDDKPLTKMGSYIVDDVEVYSSPSQMRVVGKASNTLDKNLSKKIKAPKSKSWHGYSLVGIITAIANNNGFKAAIDEYFTQIYISHLDQTDESDISFLSSLAQSYGAFVKLSLGKLLFFRKGTSISSSGKELPTIKLTAKEISDWKLRVSDMQKFGKVIAKWHNFATGKEEDVFAGTDDPAYTMRYKFVSSSRALEAAKAKLDEFKRGAENLSFSISGNPHLNAENKITFTDIKYLKGKNWIISSVTHSLTDQGFTTNVTAIIKITDVE